MFEWSYVKSERPNEPRVYSDIVLKLSDEKSFGCNQRRLSYAEKGIWYTVYPTNLFRFFHEKSLKFGVFVSPWFYFFFLFLTFFCIIFKLKVSYSSFYILYLFG